MKDTFDINRFGKYFLHDLRNAKNNFGLSLLVCGCLPVIYFLFYQFFYRIFSGGTPPESLGTQITAAVTGFLIVILTFPVKAYGGLTEKKAGTQWLMIPASGFEKWLSMILISCVVLPLCLFTLLFGTDALLALFFPGSWPEPLFSEISNLGTKLSEETEGILNLNFGALIFLQWPENILLFLLGAIVFKKGKVAKTFLAMFALSMVFCCLSLIFKFNINIGPEEISSGEAEQIVKRFITFCRAGLIMWTAVLMAGIYARIKTLKH